MKIFIHNGTHWDREWYQPFQGFRFRLVNMFEDLMNGLESCPDYGVFHTDGQTIVLEDFLEIEPGEKERLTGHIQSGKIAIGPWYCMPDEFLVSGESLIRNLRRGTRIAHSYGVEPPKNAYICDIFGHAAQTPQIFSSMGFYHTVLGRGTNKHNTPCFFKWLSPDGSNVRVFRLEENIGYGDFIVPVSGPQDDETLKKNLKEFFDKRISESNIPVVFSLYAIDHIFMNHSMGRYISLLKEIYPDAEIYQTNIDEAGYEVDRYIDSLPEIEGELNQTSKNNNDYLHLITNTLSSRYPIKKANDIAQVRMEKWLDPAYAFGYTNASKGYLDLAEKYLLQNHPHDSICGCSIDQVHRDMMYRFDQNRLIGDEIMKTVSAYFTTPHPELVINQEKSNDVSGDLVVRIYNPLPYNRTETLRVQINFPKDYPKYREPFGYESICRFKLYDCEGNEMPYGIFDKVEKGGCDEYTVEVQVNLTAASFTELLVRQTEMPSRYPQRLLTGAKSAENEYLAVEINPDGSVKLTDKPTGCVYDNLLTMLDDGEIGDGWYHCNPAIDKIVTNNSADVEIIENNALAVTFKITQHMMLPSKYTRGTWEKSDWGIRRNDEYVAFDVVHFVTMAKGERHLTVKTEINNNVYDHRLRLRLPTGINGRYYYADLPFCFVRRECGDKPETADWMEYGCIEKQTGGITAKFGSSGGFAFISKYGLHECGTDENGNIDITLFRAFCQTVGTTGEPDGELTGPLTFEYLLCPVNSNEKLADLAKKRDAFSAGVMSVCTGEHTASKYKPVFELEGGNMVYSTAQKSSDNGSEIRFYNCSDETGKFELTLPSGAKKAESVELDGRIIKEYAIDNGKITGDTGKWKIMTIKVSF